MSLPPRPRPPLLLILARPRLLPAGGVRAARAREVSTSAPDEWRGENHRGNPWVGAIPGAVHLEWLHFVTQDERRVFRPAEEMWAVLASAGIFPRHTVLTCCQPGIRAAHGTFVLRLLGFGARACCYDGSMAEWTRHPEAPLVRPASDAPRAPAG